MKRLSWILLLTTAACSPGTTTPDASTDGSTNDATLKDGGVDAPVDAPGDAPADVEVDAPFDAGACPPLSLADGGACNALTVTGSSIVPSCHNTAPPTPVGGPIYNGHYVLTKIDYYKPASCPTEAEQIDWAICGNVWATVQASQNNPTQHINASVTPTGSTLDINLTCPNPATATWTYDATSSGIVFYLSLTGADGGKAVRADTYVKM